MVHTVYVVKLMVMLFVHAKPIILVLHQIVDLSAWSVQNVHLKRLVLIKNVLTLALIHVGKMLNAELLIIAPCVAALQTTLEIHLTNASMKKVIYFDFF